MNKKIIASLLSILVLSGCGTAGSDGTINKDGQIKVKDKEKGIELMVKLDKASYSATDKITIDVTAKNISGKDIEYSGGSSCSDGFGYNTAKGVDRLYNTVKDGRTNYACLMVITERVFEKNAETTMKLELTPVEFIDDRHLYPGEKIGLSVSYLGVSVDIPLEVEIEMKEREKGIPKNAEEAAQLHLNNEIIKEWMEENPLDRTKLEIASASGGGSEWLIEYAINEHSQKRIKLRVESDTGKVIGATIYERNKEEVIIPQMVLRTAFENEIKKNPEKIYKVTVHHNDFRKSLREENTNEEKESGKHIEIIKSHGGEVVHFSKWVYTYSIEMKGKDILEMSKTGEWEYIRPGGLLG